MKKDSQNNVSKVVEESPPATQISPAKNRERLVTADNIFSALFTISIGVILLLNSTNIVPWSIWGYLWRFWPLLLIVWGLQIIFRENLSANIVVNILGLIAIIFVFILGLIAVDPNLLDRWKLTAPAWMVDLSRKVVNAPGADKSQEIVIKDSDFSNVKTRELFFNIGASDFEITDDNSSDFFKLDAKYYEHFGEPKVDRSLDGSNLILKFGTESKQIFNFPSKYTQYTFTVGKPKLETSIDINLGVGSGKINFDELVSKKTKIDIGAGNLEMSLKNDAIPTEEIEINVGAGSMKLDLPDNVGYKINYDIGVGNIKANGKEIGKFGDESEYKSDNYDQSMKKINIKVDVGVGTFEII